MIISKKVYTDVLSSRHVSANGSASACRGGKSIVFFMECLMFKKKKKRKRRRRSLNHFLLQFLLSDTVRVTSCTRAPPTFWRYLGVTPAESRLPNSGLCFFAAVLKGKTSRSCDCLRNAPHRMTQLSKLSFTNGEVTQVRSAQKRWRRKSMWGGGKKKKCFKDLTPPWVFAKSYMPLYDVCTSVLCEDTQVEMPEPQKAEFSQRHFRVCNLQAASRHGNELIYVCIPGYVPKNSNKHWLFSKLTLQ